MFFVIDSGGFQFAVIVVGSSRGYQLMESSVRHEHAFGVTDS